MEIAEYEVMFRHENDHWWYVGLRDLIRASLPDQRAPLRLLDAGCGTGRLLEEWPASHAFGLERSSEAFRFLRRRSLDNVAQGSICRIPFRDDTFDVVVSADVLCCIEAPGDAEALREIARVLRPGGVAVLNLPACAFLRGQHDRAVHIRQRYSRPRLHAMLAAAGLVPSRLTYHNTLLFPIAATWRLSQGRRAAATSPARSDLVHLPGWLNSLLLAPLLLENRLIRAGLRLPFGLSLFGVARKPDRCAIPPCPTEERESCVLVCP